MVLRVEGHVGVSVLGGSGGCEQCDELLGRCRAVSAQRTCSARISATMAASSRAAARPAPGAPPTGSLHRRCACEESMCVFFAILPIDVNRAKIIRVEGEDPGSPENPKIFKKFLYCTSISSVIFGIIYLLIKFEYLNLRNIIN